MKNYIAKAHLEKSFSYQDYCLEINRLLREGKVTGINQSSELMEYTRLHVHRMQRIDKTVTPTPELSNTLKRITIPQTWIVLTEGWCGDAAQIIPILNAIATLNSVIELKILLRDDNLELMDQYLTHGKSRSIPKLVVTQTHNLEELFHWGPRPHELQLLMNEWVADEVSFEEMKYALHLWYAKNKGVSIQKEIRDLLEQNM